MKAHDPKIKSKAVAALLAGESVNDVAKKFKLPQPTISTWKQELPSDIIQSQKKESLLSLIEGHLSSSLKAATALAERCSTDREWIYNQSAREIAILYGVLSDKSIRLIEAAQTVYRPQAE